MKTEETDREPVGEFVAIERLRPHPKNPRKNEEAVKEIAHSIKRFGFTSPIIARSEDNTIIAGHTRYKAAQYLGLSNVPVVFVDLNPTDSELLMIADNKLGEKATWDNELLSGLLQNLHNQGEDLDVLGFSGDELVDLLYDLTDNQEPEEDSTEGDSEEEQEPISKAGEIYHLGEHRLMCGDSTDPDNWALLLEGEKIDMIFTDPPYGISYVGKTEQALTIQNDELTGEALYQFLYKVFTCLHENLKAGGACYVATPMTVEQFEFMRCLMEFKLYRHKLVWVKSVFAMGRSDYHYQHEEIFYGWKEGAGHYFINDRTKSTTLFHDKPSSSRIHPTMKPVSLVEDLIGNSSKKLEIIADAFGGSGSTMIAAANLNRRSRLMELDPKYCDAIRRRWKKYAIENNIEIGDGID